MNRILTLTFLVSLSLIHFMAQTYTETPAVCRIDYLFPDNSRAIYYMDTIPKNSVQMILANKYNLFFACTDTLNLDKNSGNLLDNTSIYTLMITESYSGVISFRMPFEESYLFWALWDIDGCVDIDIQKNREVTLCGETFRKCEIQENDFDCYLLALVRGDYLNKILRWNVVCNYDAYEDKYGYNTIPSHYYKVLFTADSVYDSDTQKIDSLTNHNRPKNPINNSFLKTLNADKWFEVPKPENYYIQKAIDIHKATNEK